MKKRLLTWFLLGIVLIASAAASAEPHYGGTFRGFTSADPKTLDPAALSSWDQAVMAANVLEGLVRLSPSGQEIEPGVAESWVASEDGLVWQFEIRRDAKFHNGDAVTAADVKYSFERVINPKTRSPRAWIFNAVAGVEEFRAGEAPEVSGIRVRDEHLLEIELVEALSPFLAMLASPSAAVVSERAVDEYGDLFGQNVVSAGPFKLSEWRQNLDLTLDAFEDYWAGRPYLDHLQFRFILDENTRMMELMAGQLDWAWIPPAYYMQVSRDPNFKDSIRQADTLHVGYLAVNMEKEPFGSNLALRQAIRYAIDEEAVKDSLQGRENIAVGPFPPGFLGHDPEATPYPRNVEMAKKLMAEAGYPDGIDQTFTVMCQPYNNLIKIMEIYQQNLREIGIDVEIKPTEGGEYLSALETGNYELAWAATVADYADPDAFVYPLYYSGSIDGGGNVARYINPDIDRLIEEGRLQTDSKKRQAIYEEIARIAQEDLPYINLSHNIWVDLTSPKVKNHVPSAMDMHIFHRVWVEQ